jgi:hypothetical protein
MNGYPRRRAARGARHNPSQMDPSRKRRIRFVVALSVAVLLAGAPRSPVAPTS